MTEKKLKFGKIYSLIYLLLVGAIGSGLWDVFLKDIFYFAGEVFVTLASSVYEGYFDRLYEDVGKQLNILLYLPSIFLIIVFITFPLFLYFHLSFMQDRIESKLGLEAKSSKINLQRIIIDQFVHHRSRVKWAVIAPLLIVSIVYLDILIVSVSTFKAESEVERSIEIIRPYVTDSEIHKLSSDFRLIDNRQKLQEIINKIDRIAFENEIPIPKFKLYGIKYDI